ncbi:MAG: tetratricopeptide repeat protein [Spirochaetaceae bacterium]|nr:tetratricopeptide repeat protein [Spirochaetaceae bacterium]
MSDRINNSMDIDEPILPELSMVFDFGDVATDSQHSEEDFLERISELSKQGYSFLNEDDTKNAMIEFKRILELDACNNYALVGLGDAMRKEKKYDEAITYYEECLKHHPKNNYALFGLADCYKIQRKYSQSIDAWNKYLKLDPYNVTVLTRIADAHRKNGDFDEAKAIYAKVLTLSENNTYALIGLGHLYYDFKKYREALGYWSKVLELSGEDIDIRVLTSIGNCYRKLKTFNKALPYFIAAVKKDNANFYALFGLADCYRGLNEHENSIHYWKAILDLDPHNKVILTRLGDAYRNIGDFDKAEDTYNRAMSIAYDSYAALGLAILQKERGNYFEAISNLSEIMVREKKSYRIYLELAKCYVQVGEKEKALQVLENFKQYGIRNSEINDFYNKIKNV